MEFIYILKQDWNNPYEEMGSCIIGAYKDLEKAQKQLRECYEEDKRWIIEEHDACLEEELEDNECSDLSSFVQYGDYWSSNEILKTQLQ